MAFVVLIVIYEMYTATIAGAITSIIRSADCPEFYASYDLTTRYSKRIALEDYRKPHE